MEAELETGASSATLRKISNCRFRRRMEMS